MISEDERREVAENLRLLADYPGYPIGYAEQFREELSNAVMADDCMPPDCSELFQRLADLIEPPASVRECVPGECPINVRACDDIIDRAALLAIADEMVLECDGCHEHDRAPLFASDVWGYADRIREACGIEKP